MLLSVVRNEILRLPYWLNFYRSKGVEQFFIVDNGSTDGTTQFLLSQTDVYTYYTRDRFSASPGSGLVWKHELLDHYCDKRWVLAVDADELLIWPNCEEERIPEFIQKITRAGATALFTLMIDMYSEKGFGEIGYEPGLPFLDFFPYFDPGPFSAAPARLFPYREIFGGVRARLFKEMNVNHHSPTVSKIPLLYWQKGQRFRHSQHFLEHDMRLAPVRGALLHFKMLDDLPEKCANDSIRDEYYAGGREYRALETAIQNAPKKSFYDPRVSIRYTDSNQLVQLGIMR